jgi:hypothetical protein
VNRSKRGLCHTTRVPSPDSVTQTRTKRAGFAFLGVCAIIGAGCGDDDETRATTTSSVAVSTSGGAATTEPAPATPPTAATTTTTTIPATTTAAPTATAAAVPAGWMEVDDLPAWAFPPCCADTWAAPGPSPALPATGDGLEDGVYFADIATWSPAQPDTVTLAIHRFERCGPLAEDVAHECASWGPDEVFVDSDSIERKFTLDDAFDVGITGFECEGTNISGQSFRGDGSSLAELWSALEADYATWVRAPFDPDVPAGDLTVQLDADPASTFKRTCYGADDAYLELVWAGVDGPALLFQSLLILNPDQDAPVPRRPEQLLLPAVLEIRDGLPVLYLYEGYRP